MRDDDASVMLCCLALAKNLFFAFLMCSFVVGCDNFCSIERSVNAKIVPSYQVVESALNETFAAQHVRYVYTPIPRALYWSLHGAGWDPAFDQYYCENVEGGSEVEVHPTDDGGSVLKLYSIWINRIPTKIEQLRARRSMDMIYSALAERLPELPPPSAVSESSKGLRN